MEYGSINRNIVNLSPITMDINTSKRLALGIASIQIAAQAGKQLIHIHHAGDVMRHIWKITRGMRRPSKRLCYLVASLPLKIAAEPRSRYSFALLREKLCCACEGERLRRLCCQHIRLSMVEFMCHLEISLNFF